MGDRDFARFRFNMSCNKFPTCHQRSSVILYYAHQPEDFAFCTFQFVPKRTVRCAIITEELARLATKDFILVWMSAEVWCYCSLWFDILGPFYHHRLTLMGSKWSVTRKMLYLVMSSWLCSCTLKQSRCHKNFHIHWYSISQGICTRFCCALLCCGYAIVHNEFTWSIYPYSSGLLCWHWGNR